MVAVGRVSRVVARHWAADSSGLSPEGVGGPTDCCIDRGCDPKAIVPIACVVLDACRKQVPNSAPRLVRREAQRGCKPAGIAVRKVKAMLGSAISVMAITCSPPRSVVTLEMR